MTEQATRRRLTVQEAAELLGTSVDAIRMRARRGTLQSEKEPDGRVYIYLNDDSSETKHRLDGEPTALISAKDETIAVLREQLEAEREAHREARRIIAGLVQRVPEIEAAPTSAEPAPREPTESPDPTGTPTEATAGPQKGSPRRLWRRIFGG